MKRLSVVAAVLAAGAACGVPKEQFEDVSRKYKDEEGKSTALQAKVKELETELQKQRQKVAELTGMTDELSRSKKSLAEAKESLEKKSSEYEGLANSLKTEIDAGKVELSELKGRMTVKMKDKILFSSGSARVGKEGQDALGKVAEALQTLHGKIIRVEGHTDDVPTDPKSQFKSNWELSLARAMAVVRYFQDHGVDPGLLSAAGYGQYHPLAPNDSPENKSQNRRIEIVLAPGS
jgi:chemotaxis protein MotB